MEREQPEAAPGLVFASFIAERTRDFVGRRWLEEAVDAWLGDPRAPAFFLVTGDPGVGKSAFAAHLVRSRPSQISMAHFCSARLGGWIDPLGFARSTAAQLALRVPDYSADLLAQEGVRIEATQRVGRIVGGSAVNVLIGSLEVADPEDAFNRLVRGPLLRLGERGWNRQLVLLVDGLDEALAYTGRCSIVDLLARARDLPAFLRILVTSRSERRVLRYWDDIPHLRIEATGEENLGDLRSYVSLRVRRALAPDAATGTEELVERIVAKSAGNFLYVSYLMDAFERHPDTRRMLEELPEGLDGVYRLFLNSRDVGKDLALWEERFLPVVGVLALAKEPLAEEQLARFTGLDAQRVQSVVRDLWQYLSQEPGDPPAYRIYHQSFVDFLTSRERAQEYAVVAQVWHARIAAACWGGTPASRTPPREPDGYALRHLAAHLAGAGMLDALHCLVEDGDWYRRKLALDSSGAAYARDVECALREAVRAGSVPEIAGYALLLARVTAPFSAASVERISQLVAQGHVPEAMELATRMARPTHRALALTAAGTALHRTGRRPEAVQAWRQALAAAHAEGNPVRSGDAARSLCIALFESGEEPLAEEALAACFDAIRRNRIDRLRLGGWAVLADALLALPDAGPARRAVDALVSEALALPHRVRFHGGGDHEDPAYTYYDGIWEKQSAVQAAVELVQRVDDRTWCLGTLERLAQVVATVPTREKVYGSPLDENRLRADMPPDSPTRSELRQVIGRVRDRLEGLPARRDREGPSRTDARVRLRLGGALEWSAGSLPPPGTERAKALERLERIAAGAALSAPPPPPLRERALSLLAGYAYVEEMRAVVSRLPGRPTAAELLGCRAELEALAARTMSGPWSLLPRLLLLLGGHAAALDRVALSGDNAAAADELLRIAWGVAGSGASDAPELLERIRLLSERLWALEQRSRVLAGVACALDRLGRRAQAWEAVEGIAYQNVRVDAAVALLMGALQRGERIAVEEAAHRLEPALDAIWARGEAVRGWLALTAAAAWLEEAALRDQHATSLRRAWRSSARLEHGAYRSFLRDFEKSDWDHGLPRAVATEDVLRAENAFAVLVAKGCGELALEALLQLPGAVDARAALQLMAAAALDAGEPDLYREVLRHDAGRLELELARPEWERRWGETLRAAVPLPARPIAAQARRWLSTAFLAAAPLGPDEVWHQVLELAPLLQALHEGTPEAVLRQLVRMEQLHQESPAPEPSA